MKAYTMSIGHYENKGLYSSFTYTIGDSGNFFRLRDVARKSPKSFAETVAEFTPERLFEYARTFALANEYPLPLEEKES